MKKPAFYNSPINAPNQQGSTLLLAVFIVFGIIGASLVISALVLNEIRSTRDIAWSTAAYYGAESIVERQSYEIKQGRFVQENLQTTLNRLTGLSSQSFLDASVIASSEQESKELQGLETFLIKDASLQLDLFDPDLLIGGVDEVLLRGQTASGWLELTLSAVDGAGQPIDLPNPKVLIGPTEIAAGYRLSSLIDTQNYRLRVKALYDLVHDLSIQPFDAGGSPEPIKGMLGFEGRARFGDSVQRSLSVVHPWTVPPSGMFDFGIFSEGKIEK